MSARFLDCRGRMLPLGERTLIMGILNVTPDSFSDGGRYNTVERAVAQARRLVEDGADILDIGGESTRPGSAAVSLEEELERIIPVIEAVSRELDTPISVDTYKPEAAKLALEAGASIINDIWGFRRDRRMAEVAAAYGCPVVLMHNREEPVYADFLADVKHDLLESVAIAREAGVDPARIILDPGIGFAKNQAENLYILRHLGEIAALGYPVLLGTSRKRVIRNVLDVGTDEAYSGTAATVAWGIAQGMNIMRVHDVLGMSRVARMTDAILHADLRNTD
ncbi:dihydropteroate synthase [Paenibacillus mesotrionivorans]|uniref:Dihydropteroate synthase n=1 Tax=Paenibacillus mesotrionivorans TaxID=3160968 RepID=A0ACC7P634_9BACL